MSGEITQESLDLLVTMINNKADRDLNNITDTSALLKESYRNGTSFYRIYNDGWCVQGGRFEKTQAAAYVFIELLKPYPDDQYNVQLTLASKTNAYASAANPVYYSVAYKVQSGFQIYCYNGLPLTSKDWLACGYLW